MAASAGCTGNTYVRLSPPVLSSLDVGIGVLSSSVVLVLVAVDVRIRRRTVEVGVARILVGEVRARVRVGEVAGSSVGVLPGGSACSRVDVADGMTVRVCVAVATATVGENVAVGVGVGVAWGEPGNVSHAASASSKVAPTASQYIL